MLINLSVCLCLYLQPKSSEDRQAIKNAKKDGVNFIGTSQVGSYKLDDSYIAETIILSDLFDINEIEALELLLTG